MPGIDGVCRRVDRWTRHAVWLAIAANTVDDLRPQARPTSGDAAEPGPAEALAERGPARRLSFSQRVDGWTRYGIWLVIVAKMPGEQRFQTSVITSVIGALAVAGLLKDNQVRPVRRAIAWYNVHGQVHDIEVLHHAAQVVKPEGMLEARATHPG